MSKNTNTAVVVEPTTEVAAETSKKTLPSIEEMTKKGYGTTSARIRFLHAEGFSRSEIANHLGKRYQHVRNVLVTILKKDETK